MYWCEHCNCILRRTVDLKKHIAAGHTRKDRRKKINIYHIPGNDSENELDENMTLEEAIDEILFDMWREKRVTMEELGKYTVGEIHRLVLKESITDILQRNELDVENQVEECKTFMLTYNNVILEGSKKDDVMTIIDEIRMEKINKAAS